MKYFPKLDIKYIYISSIGLSFLIFLYLLVFVWRVIPLNFDRDRGFVVMQSPHEGELTVLSDTYEINRIYKSMKGPASVHEIVLSETKDPELLWITGFKAVMVGPDGKTPMSQEFMCHSNLDVKTTQRLFTLSQGQYEIRFPEGYGIPLYSTERLSLTTQVLNLNDAENDYKVRHKVGISYVKDSDLKTPMKPLIPVAAYGLKLLEGKDGYYGVSEPDKDSRGSSCLLGENADTHVHEDSYKRKFTGHWVVKPGREVNHTLVTKLLNVPYDTTIHYIAVHLHPFAESLELRDLTTGETVFKSRVRSPKGRIGIDEVEHYSSEEGIPIFKGHEYELISIYNNTTNEDQDSMAVMFLYLLDKNFERPRLRDSARQVHASKIRPNKPRIERSPATKRITGITKISED